MYAVGKVSISLQAVKGNLCYYQWAEYSMEHGSRGYPQYQLRRALLMAYSGSLP